MIRGYYNGIREISSTPMEGKLLVNKILQSLNPVAAMRFLPMIEEYVEQYEEEDYEDTTCSTSYIVCRDDFDELFPPYYDESIWQESTSVSG